MNLREKKIYKVTFVGTGVNAGLIVLKFIAGIVGRSSAMLADAVHSLSDFITDVIVLVFVHIADKPRDKGHDYGHGKFETLATLIIGFILVLAGLGLMINGIDLIIKSCHGHELPQPTYLALIVAVVSIVSKEILYRYTVRVGKQVNSQAVVANAWHHRSDAISSLGTFVGIAGAMFLGHKWRVLDPVAAVVVSVFIIKSGIDIMKPCIGQLLDASLPEKKEREIERIARSVDGVEGVHNLRTRSVGNDISIEMHAMMDGNLTLFQAHDIATQVEKALKKRYGHGTMLSIHMEPFNKEPSDKS